MNRLTTAFSSASAVPSTPSDPSNHPSSSTAASPTDAPPGSSRPSFENHVRRPSTSMTSSYPPQIYDDPRSTHFSSTPDKLYIPSRFSDRDSRRNSGSRTRRPELLRHVSDNALTIVAGSGRSGNSTPRGYRAQSGSRDRGDERDKSVKAVLGNGKRRERLGAMCKGPDEKYAVGGPQYLKILRVCPPTNGDSSSGPSSTSVTRSNSPRGKGQPQVLSRGIGGTTITEISNLWKTSWAVSKGVNDLDWGTGNYDKKIVTATPSGNFMLFDLIKNRLEKDISGGHPRPLNCIRLCQNIGYGHLLLTGSTEGIAKIWDLRECCEQQQQQSTIIISSKKYYKHSAAVTSLCFSPIDSHYFAVGTENGGIKRYDIRMAPRPTGSVWGAHGNKGVTDLKWREGYEGEMEGSGSSSASGGWMASAGADKTVQIWDMSQSWDKPPIPLHTLHTAHPVRRVSWRPSRPTELAIVPMSLPVLGSEFEVGESTDTDAHIEIWDVRRHYIAKYALPSSDGVAIDIAWGEDSSSIVTAFQNGVLAQLDVRERTLPLEGIPRQLVGWSPHGEIVYGLDRFKAGEIPFDDLKVEYANHWDKVGQRPKAISDPPYEPLQSIGFTHLPHSDPEEFAYLAQGYKIEGDTPDNLSRWNSEVASLCGRKDDARIWGFLASLAEEFAPTLNVQGGGGKGTFDEEIFAHPLLRDSQKDNSRGNNTSPRGGSISLPSENRSSIGSPVMNLRDGEIISLDRINNNDQEADSESIEELIDPISTGGEDNHRNGRIISFIPPDQGEIRRLSEARTSISTVVPTRSSVITVKPNSQGPTTTSTPNRIKSPVPISRQLPPPPTINTESRIGRTMIKTNHGHVKSKSNTAYSDYPDPYGIAMSASASGSTSRSTSSRITTRDPSPAKPAIEGVIQLSTAATRTRHNSREKFGLSGDVDISGSVPRRLSREKEAEIYERRRSSEAAKAEFPPAVKRDFALESGGNKGKNGEKRKGSAEEKGRGLVGDLESEVYKKERCRPLIVWWEACLDEGDVQLATTLLIVASSIVSFPKKKSERVVHSYIDMLDRAQLPLQSAYIKKYAQILSLEIYAQDNGITHISHCQRCRKSTGSLEEIGFEKDGKKKFWWCKKCRLAARICVICRQGVKGLWMGCGRCGHGGHQNCLRTYYLSAQLLTSPTIIPTVIPPTNISQAGSSGLQRTLSLGGIVGTSHDSSGFITRSSNEISHRDQISVDPTPGSGLGTEEVSAGQIVKGWNICPGGCGCKCRSVLIYKDEL